MKKRLSTHAMPLLLTLLTLACGGCGEDLPLDAAGAETIIRSRMFERQPAYAEVPMTVQWGPEYPKDEFDERALVTLAKLEEAGLVTVARAERDDGMTVVSAETTPEGFRELGTVPSARGPALRGRIAEKVIDRIEKFERHPSQPRVGRAEVVWHYENPTPLYDLFETKQDKPLDESFRTIVSINHTDRGWIVDIVVPKM